MNSYLTSCQGPCLDQSCPVTTSRGGCSFCPRHRHLSWKCSVPHNSSHTMTPLGVRLLSSSGELVPPSLRLAPLSSEQIVPSRGCHPPQFWPTCYVATSQGVVGGKVPYPRALGTVPAGSLHDELRHRRGARHRRGPSVRPAWSPTSNACYLPFSLEVVRGLCLTGVVTPEAFRSLPSSSSVAGAVSGIGSCIFSMDSLNVW